MHGLSVQSFQSRHTYWLHQFWLDVEQGWVKGHLHPYTIGLVLPCSSY